MCGDYFYRVLAIIKCEKNSCAANKSEILRIIVN